MNHHNPKEITIIHYLGKIVKYLLLFIITFSSIINNTSILNIVLFTCIGTISTIMSSFIRSILYESSYNSSTIQSHTPVLTANIPNNVSLEKIINVSNNVISKILRALIGI